MKSIPSSAKQNTIDKVNLILQRNRNQNNSIERERERERKKEEKRFLVADVISRPQKLIRSRGTAGTDYRQAESVSLDRIIA